ncbi:MAG TPA: hypothetical protein VFW92_06580 [Candidatus Limnocylindrales bacterium]|nr:hypothetical protein [Candidatus Limnocylindrales bacterium]
MRSAVLPVHLAALRSALVAAGRAVLWVLVALAISVGSAGVIQGAAHPPGDASRPELTARADAQMAPRIVAFRTGIVALQQQVAQLSDLGRKALVALRDRESDKVTAALDAGDQLVLDSERYASQLAAAFRALPYGPDASALGGGTRQRLTTIDAAIHAVSPVASDWATVSARAVPTIRLMDLLTSHDQQTIVAAELGSAGRYNQALSALEKPLSTLDQAGDIRDQLADVGTDTSTIDAWIGLDRSYDLALQKVYKLLAASHGRVTASLRSAITALDTAKAALPKDTQGLVVIVGDIAQSGLTQALIDIDVARGRLTDAALAVH